ncbi:ribosome-associated translation inhibitor RaiA [Actinocorallia lasiicapitis]
MDIIVTGRHTEVNERFKQHLTTKLAKIERLDSKIQRVDVEVTEERNPRRAEHKERIELTLHSKGPVVRAEAAAEDRYGALDLALDKLDARLRKSADRRKWHGGRKARDAGTLAGLPDVPVESVGGAERVAVGYVAEKAAEEADGNLVAIEMDGDGPVVVREKGHTAAPMTVDQALYEMELVGHDFFLFSDKESGKPSVVYRRRGWDYGVIRLSEE